MLRAISLLSCVCGLFLSIVASPLRADEPGNRHVIVICVDGLPAYLFQDQNAPIPTIRKLANEGVVSEGMIVSNPSVTWPNHTSMMTGVRPEKHGVLFNGVLERPGPGLPVKVNARKDKSELVHVATLYDALHKKGLSIAGINWPCTRNSGSIADDFPDVPDTFEFTTPRFVDSLKQAGIISDAGIREFGKLSSPARDRIWTLAACQVIQQRKPNLVLFHLLNVDGTHHKYGPQTPAGYTAVAYADSCVREVVDAIDAAGIRSQTTIMIVSDHGFMAIPKTLQPNVVLRQAGLLTVDSSQITAARVHVYPEGGIGMVYFTVPDQADADRKKTIELFQDREEIAQILTPADFPQYGLPLPSEYPAMADLILVAKDGYGFGANATGDDFVIKSETTVGTHGFPSTNAKMNATFIASGNGIRRGGMIGVVENIDVAPTIAKLLQVSLPNVDGKVLTSVLQQSE